MLKLGKKGDLEVGLKEVIIGVVILFVIFFLILSIITDKLGGIWS